jgi:hypothetical protein
MKNDELGLTQCNIESEYTLQFCNGFVEKWRVADRGTGSFICPLLSPFVLHCAS